MPAIFRSLLYANWGKEKSILPVVTPKQNL